MEILYKIVMIYLLIGFGVASCSAWYDFDTTKTKTPIWDYLFIIVWWPVYLYFLVAATMFISWMIALFGGSTENKDK